MTTEEYVRSAMTKVPQEQVEWFWYRAFLLGMEAARTPDVVTIDWIKARFQNAMSLTQNKETST